MLGRITYNLLDSINQCKKQGQSCSWFDALTTTASLIRVEWQCAEQKVDTQRFTIVPEILFELLFIILARHTDASLVCSMYLDMRNAAWSIASSKQAAC